MELATPRPLATSLALWRGMGVGGERLAASRVGSERQGGRLEPAVRQVAPLDGFLCGDLGNLPLAVARPPAALSGFTLLSVWQRVP